MATQRVTRRYTSTPTKAHSLLSNSPHGAQRLCRWGHCGVTHVWQCLLGEEAAWGQQPPTPARRFLRRTTCRAGSCQQLAHATCLPVPHIAPSALQSGGLTDRAHSSLWTCGAARARVRGVGCAAAVVRVLDDFVTALVACDAQGEVGACLPSPVHNLARRPCIRAGDMPLQS